VIVPWLALAFIAGGVVAAIVAGYFACGDDTITILWRW